MDIRSYGRKRSRGLSETKKTNLKDLYELFGIVLDEVEDKNEAQNNVQKQIFPQDFFSNKYNDIVLEIGFGNGEYLIKNAKENSDIGFIGCEVFENGVASALKNIVGEKLQNVRIFKDDVRILLRILKDNSLKRVYVLFPDPWPKARHHKRRLLSENFIRILLQKIRADKNSDENICEGGELIIATDCQNYMEEILEHIKKIPEAQNFVLDESVKNPSCFLGTKYERKAREKNTNCYYLRIKR